MSTQSSSAVLPISSARPGLDAQGAWGDTPSRRLERLEDILLRWGADGHRRRGETARIESRLAELADRTPALRAAVGHTVLAAGLISALSIGLLLVAGGLPFFMLVLAGLPLVLLAPPSQRHLRAGWPALLGLLLIGCLGLSVVLLVPLAPMAGSEAIFIGGFLAGMSLLGLPGLGRVLLLRSRYDRPVDPAAERLIVRMAGLQVATISLAILNQLGLGQ